jgi:hypothetical protein
MPDMTPVNANFSNVNGTSSYEDSSFSGGNSVTNTETSQQDGLDGPQEAGVADFLVGWAAGHVLDWAVGQAAEGAQALWDSAQQSWDAAVNYAENCGAGAGAPPGVASPSSSD